jgi:Outer membrane lipoprotein-sorting protein
MHTRKLLFTALALSLSPPAWADKATSTPSARDIMDKVTTTRKLDGSEAVIKMTVVGEGGQAREREISMATKLYDGGKTEKRIYRFLSPADVQGTGILVYDYADKPDDVWIYLPALRKTRRVVSSQRSQSFMGSEFSYGDLNIPSLDDFTYTLAKEEPMGGEACYVVDLVPKNKEIADAEGYSKKTYWVSKAKMAVVRGLYYDKDGKLLKELTAQDIKLLDPKNKRYRAMHMEMTNKQNGRKSVFETKKVTFSPNTKDDYFTTAYLERS